MNARQWFGGSLRRDLTSDRTLKPRAAKLQVYNATGATRTLTLESATLYEPGPGIVTVANEGDVTIAVRDFDSTLVVNISAGSAAKLSLVDNSTDAGEWVSSTKTFSADAQVAYNLVIIMMDDTGRSQMPQYDDLNRWPGTAGTFPYPEMPHLTDDVLPRAIRFTQARVNARCAPTRASIFTGRLPHRTSVHPDGTGIGDVLGNVPSGQLPFYDGIVASQNPWPLVAKAAGAPHRFAMFGKYHLFNYSFPASRNNPRAIVDECGFDESHESPLSGGGSPLFGYYNYTYNYTDADTQTSQTAGVDLPEGNIFRPALWYKKITFYIAECVANGEPFVVDYEMDLPHGPWPAMVRDHQLTDPSGVNTRRLHSTYTQAQLIPDAAGTNGETEEGGWNAAGQSYESQNGGAPYVFTNQASEPYLSYPYGPEGQVHLIFRRAKAMLECVDSITKYIEEYVATNHPEAYARTVWMHYSDNGADVSALTPQETTEFAAGRPAQYANVIPPTTTGVVPTLDGDGLFPPAELYHNPDDAKGDTADEGILTSMLVWGAMVPSGLEGTDCARYTDATDLYATILDIIAPGAWRDELGSGLALVDGASFVDSITTGSEVSKPYTFHAVFFPGYQSSTRAPIYEYSLSVVGTDTSTDADGWKLTRKYDNWTGSYSGGAPASSPELTKTFYLFNLNTDPQELTDLRPAAQSDVGDEIDSAQARAFLELLTQYNAKYGATT